MTRKMTPNKDGVQNAQGEVSEAQKALETKARAVAALLKEDPEAYLDPFLRVTERGIGPDIRLILVDKTEDDGDKDSEGDAGESTEADEVSVEESGDDESAESQDTEG